MELKDNAETNELDALYFEINRENKTPPLASVARTINLHQKVVDMCVYTSGTRAAAFARRLRNPFVRGASMYFEQDGVA